MIRRINGLCETILGRYPEIIELYAKIERLEKEIASANSLPKAREKIEERRRLIGLLIEDAKANGCFHLFESVHMKSLDKELGWITTWPIKFFVPSNEKDIRTETDVLKRWIENSGGLFIPHDPCGGFFKDKGNVSAFTVILFPESIGTVVKIDSTGGSSNSVKITIVRLKLDGTLLCYEADGNTPEIAMTFRNFIPRIEME